MKRAFFLLAALLFAAPATFAQLDPRLRADVRETGFIHRPLPVREDKSFESAAALKPALTSELLCDMESLDGWSHQGYGRISLTDERCREGRHSLRLEGPAMPCRHRENRLQGKSEGRGIPHRNIPDGRLLRLEKARAVLSRGWWNQDISLLYP